MAERQFWHLDGPKSTKGRAGWADDMDFESTVICPLDEGHQRPGKRLPKLSVTLPRGEIQDFVWTWYGECLVQDKVLDLFRRHEFSGYSVKPVKAKFKVACENKLPKLWELIVTGWAGMASSESGIKLIERCEGCGHTVYSESNHPGELIDVSRWDGSDFFIVWPLPRFILVTDRVAQLIHDNGLTGATLKRPNDLDLSGGFSPGRLSHWMPEERARTLGGSLGID